MKKLTLFLLFVATLLIPATSVYAGAKNTRPSRRVIMIIVNNIGPRDLIENDLPNIKKSLNDQAAVGLMNTRSARSGANTAGAYLSIGAGAKANAGRFGHLAVDHGEKIRLYGGLLQKLPFAGAGQVVNPSLPEMSRLATKLSYRAVPGTLGDLLDQGGVKRAVFGNADNLGAYHREINLITMGSDGSTSFGNVSKQINTAEQGMTAIRTGLSRAEFVAIEFRPTSLISLRHDFLTDEQIAAKKRRQLKEADRLFGRTLKTYADAKTLVLMVTPVPPAELVKSGALQTPLIVAGPGFSGLLYSAGTRLPGLVTNSDIAPTILSFFGLPIPSFLPGRPLTSQKNPDAPATINSIADKAIIGRTARSTLLSAYITLSVAIIVGVVLILLLWPRAKQTVYLQPLLLSMMFFPLIVLIANAVSRPTAWTPIVLVPSASFIAGLLFWLVRRNRPLVVLAGLSLFTMTAVLAQLPFGSILERDSILGMSSIIGARFYGIGNEYIGVLLGSAVIAFTTGISLKPRSQFVAWSGAALLFLALTAVVGLPSLGANVGGAIATLTTGAALALLLRGQRLGNRHFIFLFIISGLMVGVILIADFLSADSSHAARAVALIKGGGLEQARQIVFRKLETNIRLISRSSWTNILLAAGGAAIALKLAAPVSSAETAKRYPALMIGFKAILIGGVAALIFNDSGVVAAAVMILFAVYSWLYLVIDTSRAPAKTEL